DLAAEAGRQPSLRAAHALDLAAHPQLRPGDVVTLTATARDVYLDRAGQRHDPARSAPRRLRIIDAATLIGQIRGELAGVRQQALRLDEQQQQAAQAPPADAQPLQDRLGRRLEAQSSLVRRL